MELGGDEEWFGGRLDEGGDQVGQRVDVHVLKPQATLLHRSEEDKLRGLLEHVLKEVGLALCVDIVDINDPEVETGGVKPELAQAVGVQEEYPEDQWVKLSGSPGAGAGGVVDWLTVLRSSQLTCLVRIQQAVSSALIMAREQVS